MDQAKPITVNLTIDGRKLTPEEFKAVKLQVDCSVIKHTVTPDEAGSAYQIKLASTEGIAESSYQ
mgnify:CR=1 FL=1